MVRFRKIRLLIVLSFLSFFILLAFPKLFKKDSTPEDTDKHLDKKRRLTKQLRTRSIDKALDTFYPVDKGILEAEPMKSKLKRSSKYNHILFLRKRRARNRDKWRRLRMRNGRSLLSFRWKEEEQGKINKIRFNDSARNNTNIDQPKLTVRKIEVKTAGGWKQTTQSPFPIRNNSGDPFQRGLVSDIVNHLPYANKQDNQIHDVYSAHDSQLPKELPEIEGTHLHPLTAVQTNGLERSKTHLDSLTTSQSNTKEDVETLGGLADYDTEMDDFPGGARILTKRQVRTKVTIINATRTRSPPDDILAPSLPTELRRTVIRELMTGPVFSFQRPAGGEVELSCKNQAMETFKVEFPMLNTIWLINGEPIKVKASRMLFQGDDVLVIQDLSPRDSGVYECLVEWDSRSNLTLAVFALIITWPESTPDLLPRETEPLELDCHSDELIKTMLTAELTFLTDKDLGCDDPCEATNLTKGVSRQWFHNGTQSSLLPGPILASRPDPDVLPAATRNMSGVWWCEVTHVTGARRWNTSWHRVFVKDPPSQLELWWRSALTRPWLVALVGFLALVLCMTVSVLVARHSQKQDENLEYHWQVMKTHMLRREVDLAPSLSLTSQATADMPALGSQASLRLADSPGSDDRTSMSSFQSNRSFK